MDRLRRRAGRGLQVLGRGDTKSSITVAAGSEGRRFTIQADLQCVVGKAQLSALHYFTGNKDHNIELRPPPYQRARPQAERVRIGRPTPQAREMRDEAEYRAFDLAYIRRRCANTAARSSWPKRTRSVLVETADITGVFHCHTTDSDEADLQLEDMAKAAKAAPGPQIPRTGRSSQSLTVANGPLGPDHRRQQEAIDALNKKPAYPPVQGTSATSSPTAGSTSTATTAGDLRLCRGQHDPSHFQQSREKPTDRIVQAVVTRR